MFSHEFSQSMIAVVRVHIVVISYCYIYLYWVIDSRGYIWCQNVNARYTTYKRKQKLQIIVICTFNIIINVSFNTKRNQIRTEWPRKPLGLLSLKTILTIWNKNQGGIKNVTHKDPLLIEGTSFWVMVKRPMDVDRNNTQSPRPL